MAFFSLSLETIYIAPPSARVATQEVFEIVNLSIDHSVAYHKQREMCALLQQMPRMVSDFVKK